MQDRIPKAVGLLGSGIVIGILLTSAVVVVAGNLDAPGGPTAPSAQMYTLAQVYDRLVTGAEGTKMTTFTEPTDAPGSTMPTLNEIMAAAPATHTCAATQTHVLSGTVTWGLSEGDWGVITGTRPYAPVPTTGQTTTYAIADDGDWGMGVAWPGSRFTDNGDGTVTDNLTGLIWLQDGNCDGQKSWSSAVSWADGLYDGCTNCGGTDNDCGLTDDSSAGDWRLPNIRELYSLIDYGEYNGAALPHGHPFANVQLDRYWSSTTFVFDTLYAWYVGMGYGVVDNASKSNDNHVWPVRGGQ